MISYSLDNYFTLENLKSYQTRSNFDFEMVKSRFELANQSIIS